MLSDYLLLSSFLDTIWPEDAYFARFIILVIIALLALSFYFFQQHRRRYRREENGVRTVEKRLEEWRQWLENQDDDELDEDIIYQPIINIERDLMSNLNQNLIISKRLKTLDQLKMARVKVNVDVLQKLSLGYEAKQWTIRFPGYVMTLAMLLGMLGTFCGLSIMVLEIGSQLKEFQSADVDQISQSMSNLQGVLSGAGTAFSTTLVGLCCTIAVSLFNFLLTQRQASFYDYLESFTAEKLLPSAFPDLEEGDVLDQISDRLKDSFEELNQTIDNNNEAIENLNGVYQRFDEIISQVQNITSSETSTQVQGAIHEMNKVNQSLGMMIDKYENEALIKEINNLGDSNKNLVSNYNSLLMDASWIPSTKIFLIVIATFLFGILGTLVYSAFFSQL